MLDELLLILGSGILLYAGTNLLRYGEAIADKTRLSATWVGLFLVAAVTSLPELLTGVGSILVVGEPDLAVGDVLGSCLVNLLLAAGAALLLRRDVLRAADRRLHGLAARYSLLMLGIGAAGIALPLAGARAGLAGLATATLVVVYFIATRHIFQAQPRLTHPPRTDARFTTLTARRAFTLYAVNGGLVVVVALLLPAIAERIAISRGLGIPFMGTAILAAATSLPELMVTIAAVRARQLAIAIGGLLGSNLFDLIILAVDDLLYASGPLLAIAAPTHLTTIAAAAIMTALLLVGLPSGRPARRLPLACIPLVYAAALLVSAFGSGQP